MSLDFPFVSSFDRAEAEAGECVWRALEYLGCEIRAGADPACEADDDGEEAFVDVVGDRQGN